jgi:hypothetical protein
MRFFASAHGKPPQILAWCLLHQASEVDVTTSGELEIETNLCTWDYGDPHDQQCVSGFRWSK